MSTVKQRTVNFYNDLLRRVREKLRSTTTSVESLRTFVTNGSSHAPIESINPVLIEIHRRLNELDQLKSRNDEFNERKKDLIHFLGKVIKVDGQFPQEKLTNQPTETE